MWATPTPLCNSPSFPESSLLGWIVALLWASCAWKNEQERSMVGWELQAGVQREQRGSGGKRLSC